jgi:DNA-binding transcriptional ArsR family regulator
MTDRPLTPKCEAALRVLVSRDDRMTPSDIGRAIGMQNKARSSIGYRLSAVWKSLVDRNLVKPDYDGYSIYYAATGQGRQWVRDHPADQ